MNSVATDAYGWLASPSREPLLPSHDTKEESCEMTTRFSFRRSFQRSLSVLLRFGKPSSVLFISALILCVSSVSLLIITLSKSGPPALSQKVVDISTGAASCPEVQGVAAAKESYVLGPPTAKFRDNLRNDSKYITSWDAAGWTNDVMAIGNMIYLGMLTDRIPIIPPFTPSHVGENAGFVNTGDVFDLAHLSSVLRSPLLEWHEVKQSDSDEVDEIGCWSIWEATHQDDDGTRKPRPHRGEETLKLDISYTRAPDLVSLGSNDHANFWGIATLGFPEYRSRHLSEPRPSKLHGAILPPDDQVMCFDILYYVSVFEPYEYSRDYSPVWRDVVRHMRWSKNLEGLAKGYIRRILDVPEGSDIPPFISVHFRRGDFRIHCPEWKTDGCFATLAMFAQAVSEVQEELWTRNGIRVTDVIMNSDEEDPAWWEEVAALGWRWADHRKERTVEIYGKWWPVLIDAVIQSAGVGFVGTDLSTMSLLAQKRTEEWNQGVSRTVRWV